jgi:C4-dicarboxylate transporter DctM subunit
MLLSIILVVLLALGLPIYVCLGMVVVVFLGIEGIPVQFLVRGFYAGIDQYPLIAVTGFILVGYLFESAGITDGLISLVKRLMQSFKAGLAVITIVACAVFAAVTGSGPATVATIGGVMIPAMIAIGYDRKFAGAVSVSGGALGILIPPSNPFLMYGIIASQSIGALFLAGVVPGILMTVALSFTAWLILRMKSKKEDYQTEEVEKVQLKPRDVFLAFWDAKWSLIAIVLLLGGIYAGFFTPIEAAEVTVFYTLIVGLFITKRLNAKNIYSALQRTVRLSGTLIILVGAGVAFSKLLTIMHIPQELGNSLGGLSFGKNVILLLIMGVMIFVGTWCETFSQIIILTPIFLPVVMRLGVDPIHFGVLFVVTAEIGFLTPPVGANLFVGMKIAKVSLEEISKSTLPFILTYIIVLLLLVFIPQISLFLPNLVF